MDAYQVPSSSKKGAVLIALALVLCTMGGGAGGLAISDMLHQNSPAQAAIAGGANSGLRAQTPAGNGWSYSLPQRGFGTESSAATETTSTATSAQLVGLVRIETTLGYGNGAAVGSGMVLTNNGIVVTNHHVVQGATKIIVTVMSTGARYQATLVGSDTSQDIAVLQLPNASGLATVSTTSTAASIGQAATAVGDAEGATSFTASPGKVTALNRTISPSDGSSIETLSGIIQYAADVMSGDSGGATYDSSGSVVGMTTAASTGGAQTNGYAIPIARVISVTTDLQNHVVNPNYTYGLPAFLGVGVNQDAVVEQVFANTGAAQSGIQVGDQIVAVGGTAINDAAQLQAATRSYRAGQSISITWTAPSGQRQTASVRLMSGPIA